MNEILFLFGKEWKQIPDYCGYYASKEGEILSLVKSKNKPRILKQIPTGEGHLYVFLYSGEKMTKMFVHRAVLLAWVGPPADGQEGRHLDDNGENNVLENLAWGSRQENVDDKKRNGGMPIGERSGTAKLTEAQVLEIRRRVGKEPLRSLAKEYGVSHTAIRRAANGTKWGHITEDLR